MSGYHSDGVFALLPAWVRVRDETDGGGGLQALLAVICAQADAIAATVDQLYDDEFIESCSPWVTPYIGDLITFRPLRPAGASGEVADTTRAGHRKRTLSALERNTADVTTWPPSAVEFYARVATTEFVGNHPRPPNAFVDVRSPTDAVDIGTAFDMAPRLSSGRDRHNLANVGIIVWRFQACTTLNAPAREIAPKSDPADPVT